MAGSQLSQALQQAAKRHGGQGWEALAEELTNLKSFMEWPPREWPSILDSVQAMALERLQLGTDAKLDTKAGQKLVEVTLEDVKEALGRLKPKSQSKSQPVSHVASINHFTEQHLWDGMTLVCGALCAMGAYGSFKQAFNQTDEQGKTQLAMAPFMMGALQALLAGGSAYVLAQNHLQMGR